MLLTKKQAGEVLKISPVTIDRLRKTGKIGFRKIGVKVFFTEDDIEKFIGNSLVPPAAFGAGGTRA
jgi:excisionase family DNA binding protein